MARKIRVRTRKRPHNPIAKALASPLFRPRIVKQTDTRAKGAARRRLTQEEVP